MKKSTKPIEAKCPFCGTKITGGYTKIFCLCQTKKTKKDKFGLEWYTEDEDEKRTKQSRQKNPK